RVRIAAGRVEYLDRNDRRALRRTARAARSRARDLRPVAVVVSVGLARRVDAKNCPPAKLVVSETHAAVDDVNPNTSSGVAVEVLVRLGARTLRQPLEMPRSRALHRERRKLLRPAE